MPVATPVGEPVAAKLGRIDELAEDSPAGDKVGRREPANLPRAGVYDGIVDRGGFLPVAHVFFLIQVHLGNSSTQPYVARMRERGSDRNGLEVY
jgi:hypothetical protein